MGAPLISALPRISALPPFAHREPNPQRCARCAAPLADYSDRSASLYRQAEHAEELAANAAERRATDEQGVQLAALRARKEAEAEAAVQAAALRSHEQQQRLQSAKLAERESKMLKESWRGRRARSVR